VAPTVALPPHSTTTSASLAAPPTPAAATSEKGGSIIAPLNVAVASSSVPGSGLDVRSSAFDVHPACASLNPELPPPQPSFHPSAGETPRAFSAFVAFFDLGHDRSLPALADRLGEKLDSLKRWSSRFRWNARIQEFNSALLQQHAAAETATRSQEAADWARRAALNREQQWEAAQKLSGAVRCFLESFGDRELEKMTLGQVSRALQISSQLARQALSGETTSETTPLAPIQLEITAALKKAYANPLPDPGTPASSPASSLSQNPTYAGDPGSLN
jgi:hypothetical protein